MSLQKNYSVLNSVLASSADYGTVNGITTLGSLVFPKNASIVRIRTAAALYEGVDVAVPPSTVGFYTLATSADISSGVITWATGTPETVLGEVLEVTNNLTGLVYYAGVPASNTTGVTPLTWFGANGIAPNGVEYTIIRKGAAFTKVVPAAISGAGAVRIIAKWEQDSAGGITKTDVYEYGTLDSPIAGTAAQITAAYYAHIEPILNPLGYYVTTASSTTVYIMQPPNTFLEFVSTPASVVGFTQAVITSYEPVTRVGYGADYKGAYGVAATAGTNGAVFSTNFYTVENFLISAPAEGGTGAVNTYNMYLLVNALSSNAAALLTTINTQFPNT